MEATPHHPYRSFRGTITAERTQRWAFDLDGFVVLSRAAAAAGAVYSAVTADSPEQLPTPANHSAEAAAALLQKRPDVAAAIVALCGSESDIHSMAENGPAWGWDGQQESQPIEYVLDCPPAFVEARINSSSGWLTDTAPEERRRLGYDTTGRTPTSDRIASVWGLRLLCCTDGQPRTVLIAPASHKSNLPPPPLAVARPMGALTAVTLLPGDCLLAAATTLVGLDQDDSGSGASRLLHLVLAERQCAARPAPSSPSPKALPPELTDAQRELMTPPSLRADPPSSTMTSDDCREVDPELWFWDNFGYIIIPGACASTVILCT
jgi:hypothetical protein